MYNSNTMQQKTIHLARTTMMLLLVMFTSLGAWATGGTLAGTGTSNDPYVIVDADDWTTFVNWINNSNSTYGSKCYKLGADITISSMAGTSSNKFKGTFDGDGYTITLNDLSSSGEFCAPFRYVDGATFKRIHTTGTVKAGSHTSNDKYRTGLVGQSNGTTTITNCWSSVAITTQISGDGTHGGFVGVVNGGTLTITNCLFDGSITGASTYANAGFVGWTGSNTTNITNCVMAGTINAGTQNSATFMRGSEKNSVANTADNIKINNSYYNTAYGTVQGTAIGSMTNAQLQTALGEGWEISGDKVLPIIGASNLVNATVIGLNLPVKWTGSVINVNYTVKDAHENELTLGTDYTATISPAVVQNEGEYTLTLTGINSYNGTKTVNFKVMKQLNGEGTESSPYLISSSADWDIFASNVNEGNPYSGKIVKLNANDVTATTMVGTSEYISFQGTFLGNNKTLTVNLTGTEDGCAPFFTIKNATIKDLNIAGSVTTGYKYGASLAVHNYGTSIIENCVSAATITSTFTSSADGTHGGFIALNEGNATLTFTDCVFAGKMLGSNAHSNGGFVGYNGGTMINYNNCLFVPSERTMSNSSSYTFNRNGNATFNGAYYVSSFGSGQGTQVYAGVQTAFCKKEITYNTTDYYLTLTPTIGNVYNSYKYTGSVISITPTVSYNSKALTQGTDYEYTITPATVKEAGQYTITFTGKGAYAGTYRKNFLIAYVFSGEGTSDSPYLIENSTDWDHFAANVSSGVTYSGKVFKLMDNITVTTMAGENNYEFCGTFDGNNKTMTLNLTSNKYYCAPFQAVGEATVKNLNITGSVTSSQQYASSLIGRVYYGNTVYINNCTSTAVITSTYKGAAYNGSFIGYTYTARFTDCVFAGKMLGADATHNGGFIGGYQYDTNPQYFTNCLFNPSEVTMSATGSKTFSCTPTSRNDFNNTYFVTAFGEEQGIRAATVAPANGLYKSEVVTFLENNYYAVCDITGINEFYLHTGSAIAVTPVVKLGSTTLTANTDYTVTIKNSSDKTVEPEELIDNGSYTLNITGTGDYTGSYTIAFRIFTGEVINGYVFETGKDAEGTYYMIQSAEDFNHLAAYVDSANDVTLGKRFKQTANITISSMIGSTESKSFQGVYDGQNYKMTLNLTTSSTGTSMAPFKYIKNATIKNLNVQGAITSGIKGASISAFVYGICNIQNCVSTVEITSNYTSSSTGNYGGFVGYVWSSATLNFNNCVFAGKLLGYNASSNGGFVGYNNGTMINYTDCLFAPSEITMRTSKSCTFNTNGKNSFTRSYYLTQYGDAQGVYVIASAKGLYQSVVATDAKTYYIPCEITNVFDVYAHTGSAITVAPVVKYHDATLTEGTDYTITITPAEVKEVGDYTLTIAGAGSYSGSMTIPFSVAEGEDFGGYVFATDNDGKKYYVIKNEADLERLAAYVNSGHNAESMRFKQTANIELTKEHTAIGTNNNPFKGTFDGDDKAISGLIINKPTENYQGLFGYTYNAQIKNVVIDNCDITASSYTGAVVGNAQYTTISYCTVSGAIKIAAGVNSMDVGGIAGYGNSIDHCINTASVTGNGTNTCLGGICGFNNYTVSNCFNAGAVTGGSYYVGSIVGQKGGSLTNNYHTVATIGGVGAYSTTTGTDQTGAEVAVKITAGDGVTLTLPAEATREWNNEKFYKSGTVVTLNYAVPDGKVFDRYTVNSGVISNAGIIDGEHMLTGFSEDVVITGTYADNVIDLATAGAEIANIANLTYNGSEQHPVPVVTLATETLEENANYTVSYEEGCTNVGTYTVTVKGTGRYAGEINKTFTIDPFDVSGCDITVSDKAYTGTAIEVAPTVKRGSTTMTQGDEKDYTFVTSPATVQNAGQYTLTITGHGNYTGTKDATFNIYYSVPTELGNTALTATTATLTWKKNGEATQWTVEYSTDNTFATSETVTVNAATVTLEGLTSDVTYYARVKAVYGVGKESDWSGTYIFQPTTKLVIGSGTNTSIYLPTNIHYNYSLTQQIYTAAEIGKSGTILNIDFYNADSNDRTRTMDIYMVNTAKSSFASSTDWINVTDAGVVKVFSGNVTFTHSQWSTITLDTPFDYDNTKNLAIIIDDNTDSYTAETKFLTFLTASNQTIWVYSDNTNYDPEKPTAYNGSSVMSYKNQLRIRLAEKINMNAHGIMTYASNNALDFKNSAASDDLKAYAVTDCNKGTLTLSKVNEAPATEGLLLKGTASETFYVNIVASADAIANNHLVGVLDGETVVEKTNGDKTNFVLANGNHGINWYGLSKAGKIGANKAYLQLSNSEISGAREFTWVYDDGTETTGISEECRVNSEEFATAQWYTVDGRKLDKQPTKKGLYIVNGRKTVVK